MEYNIIEKNGKQYLAGRKYTDEPFHRKKYMACIFLPEGVSSDIDALKPYMEIVETHVEEAREGSDYFDHEIKQLKIIDTDPYDPNQLIEISKERSISF